MTTATTSTYILHPDNPTIAYVRETPKRVILRLRVSEFEGEGRSWEQHVDAINTYLIWAGRSSHEYEGDYQTRRHFAHVEPFQAPELNQKTFHVILDIEQHSLPGANFNYPPHEIYRVRRNEKGDLQIQTFPTPREAENVIDKTPLIERATGSAEQLAMRAWLDKRKDNIHRNLSTPR